MRIDFQWRGTIGNAELSTLHTAGFGRPFVVDDWLGQLEHSLG